jgi:hypothetical protein
MSLSNYKTNINGQAVTFNDVFADDNELVNGDVDTFDLGGNNKTMKKSSFSDEPAINGDESFNIPGFDHGDKPKPGTASTAKWGYNAAIDMTNAGFSDNQRNVNYKLNNEDIGPKCCAKFIDMYGATSNPVERLIPKWVDYLYVIAVGQGGSRGWRRGGSDNHAAGGSGSSGGFIVWKSPTNLGNQTTPFWKITNPGGASNIQLEVWWNGVFRAWCRANLGFTGCTPTGNDDDDTHSNSIAAAGYANAQNTLTAYSGGTVLLRRFILGRPSIQASQYTTGSHNAIADMVRGWNNEGRGERYTGNNTGDSRGVAAVRIYFVGYNA